MARVRRSYPRPRRAPLALIFIAASLLAACSEPASGTHTEVADASAAPVDIAPLRGRRTPTRAFGHDGLRAQWAGNGGPSVALTSVMLAERPFTLASPTVRSHTDRTIIERGPVREWWTTSRGRWEQGFDVDAPSGPASGDALRITLALDGFSLLSAHDGVVLLKETAGTAVFRVADARATDDDGRALATTLSVGGAAGERARAIELRVDARHARFPVHVDPTWIMLHDELTAADAAAGAGFGASVSTTGARVAVSRPPSPAFETGTPTASGGNAGSGAVYVFEQKPDGTFGANGEFESSDAHDAFGAAVLLDPSRDVMWVGAPLGGTLMGSAPNFYGALHPFTRDAATGSWSAATPILYSELTGGAFTCAGGSLALGGSWLFLGATACRPGASFAGYSVVEASATDLGSSTPGASVASISNTSTPPSALAATSDGALIAFGVPTDGSVAASAGSFSIATAGGDAGAGFTVRDTVYGATSSFALGTALAFSASSTTTSALLLVGEPGATTTGGTGTGAVLVYAFAGSGTGRAMHVGTVAAPETAAGGFGSAISVSGGNVLIGAPSGAAGGRAYLYTLGGTTLSYVKTIAPADGSAGDRFGTSVALSGTTAVIGAPGATNHGGIGAGNVYVFDLLPTQPLGGGCSDPAGCDSGFCVDGVCCAFASCPSGQRCDVAGASGSCAAPPDAGSDAMTGDASTTTSDVGGEAPTTIAPATDAMAVLAPGVVRCASRHDCASGFCVDGVCCDSACEGRCQSCAVAGREGTCSPQPAGYDLRDECASEGTCVSTCDGAGQCGPSFAGARCANERCISTHQAATAAFCDSTASICNQGASITTECAPYLCAPAFGKCATSCLTSADCVSGYECEGTSHTCKQGTSGGGGCSLAHDRSGRARGSMLATLGLAAALLGLRRRRRRAAAAVATLVGVGGCAHVSDERGDSADASLSQPDGGAVVRALDGAGGWLSSDAVSDGVRVHAAEEIGAIRIGLDRRDGRAVGAGRVESIEGVELRRSWSGLREWWRPARGSRARGWELGWVLSDPLEAGESARDEVRLHVAASALGSSAGFSAGVRVRDAGTDALIVSEGAFDRLRIDGLAVRDADGRALDAHMIADASGFEIRVATAGGRWPIEVDPFVALLEAKLQPATVVVDDGFGASLAYLDDPATGTEWLLAGSPFRNMTGSAGGNVFPFRYDGLGWSPEAPIGEPSSNPSGGVVSFDFGFGLGAFQGTVVATSALYDYVLYASGGLTSGTAFSTGTGGNKQGRMAITRHDATRAADNGTLVVSDVTFEAFGATYANKLALFSISAASHGAVGAPAIATASDGTTAAGFGAAVAASDAWVAAGCDATISTRSATRSPVYAYHATTTATPYGWPTTESQRILPTETVLADRFGAALAMDFVDGPSTHAYTLVVGAPGRSEGGVASGAVYVFSTTDGAMWAQQAKLVPPDPADGDLFGASLALHAGTLLVGAPGKSGGIGKVYAFSTSAGAFVAAGSVVPSDGVANDAFGSTVAIGSTTFAVGNRPPSGASRPSSVYVWSTAGLPQGSKCSATGDCASGTFCTDGVCCANASCPSGESCNQPASPGLCTPLPISPDAGAEAGADAAVDGAIDGASDAATSAPDAPDAPDATDATDATGGDGASDVTDAPATTATDASLDVALDAIPRLTAPFVPCDRTHPCATGESCVGGVCCDSPCTEACHSCALPGSIGKCTLEPTGLDLRGDCPGSGRCGQTCGPSGACIAAFAGSECKPAICTGLSTGVGPAVCTGQGGDCGGSVAFDCAPYACAPALGACVGQCTTTDDCASGFSCDVASGTCSPSMASSSGKSGGCALEASRHGERSAPFAILGCGALALAAWGRRRRRSPRAHEASKHVFRDGEW